jgi:hypothetical protein
MIGDHPAWLQERHELPKYLKNGDIYLELTTGNWMPLYPFQTVATCPACKIRETYFVDKYDFHEGPAQLKSFERGHTIESRELGDALKLAAQAITSAQAVPASASPRPNSR